MTAAVVHSGSVLRKAPATLRARLVRAAKDWGRLRREIEDRSGRAYDLDPGYRFAGPRSFVQYLLRRPAKK